MRDDPDHPVAAPGEVLQRARDHVGGEEGLARPCAAGDEGRPALRQPAVRDEVGKAFGRSRAATGFRLVVVSSW